MPTLKQRVTKLLAESEFPAGTAREMGVSLSKLYQIKNGELPKNPQKRVTDSIEKYLDAKGL